ncbi:hypothetical protein DPMN_036018 [Dreissena polymorpha]|uniref:Uncharacterized protein n=1 Tax=Dreissena polymorpha TaxID=45954 RepID=A0A9D4M8P3_DREPO|nr:hypothetical protein DPMN_036018 [Dreissena polymorpha]
MNDAGHEARHIMFMSGHRNEASIRSNNRGCNITQNKSCVRETQYPLLRRFEAISFTFTLKNELDLSPLKMFSSVRYA